MAIDFPAKPQPDGKEYVDPNSGKWVYDLSNNSWTLVAPGNVSPFNYRGGHDFNSATAPTNVKSGDAWTHSGTDGAAINAVYIGMTGTIAAGQFVVFDGTEYTKVSSVAGYPNVGDGNGATLDTRYVKKKGETKQGIEGSIGIDVEDPKSALHIAASKDSGILIEDSNDVDVAPNITVGGKRSDTNGSSVFGGSIRLNKNSGAAIIKSSRLGSILFGGNHTDGNAANIGYGAAIRGLATGQFNSATDMPTGLSFCTGSEAGDPNDPGKEIGTERVRIDENGEIGIGVGTVALGRGPVQVHTTNNVCNIHLTNGNSGVSQNDGMTIFCEGTSSAGLFLREAAALRFATNNVDRARILASGKFLIGYTANVNQGGFSPTLQQHADSAAGSGVYRWSNNTGAPVLGFAKSRGTAPASFAIVQNGDPLGIFVFSGDNGKDLNSQGASITASVDSDVAYASSDLVKDTDYRIVTAGTTDFTAIGAANNNVGTVFTATGPGTGTGTAILDSGNMPARLTFATRADGAGGPTERMRIRSDGNISIGNNAGTTYQRLGINGTLGVGDGGSSEAVSVRATWSGAVGNVVAFQSRSAVDIGAGNKIKNYHHYMASPNTLVSGEVTNQYAFNATANTAGAANNYGFYSDIPVGVPGYGRWNFYANGKGSNYFAGDVLFASNNATAIDAGTVDGKRLISSNGILNSSRSVTTEIAHHQFRNPNGIVGSILTEGNTTKYEETSDYRLKENINPLTGAADQLKALKPCVYNFKADPSKTIQGFIAHEAQEVCPQAVSGTKDATEAIGTLFDWNGKVREENITEPTELTYTEEVVDDPGQEGKEAVYSEEVLIQEYQPPVYAEPELIKAATDGEEAVYADPVLISPEVPEQYSEPELISPAVEHREPTYKTVTRQMSWKKTGDRDVMQGIDKSKLVPLLTAALQEALGRIEALEAAIASKGA